MPRRPRVFLPGQPIHLIQRGHNRSRIFHGADDAKAYLKWLREACAKRGVALHAYALMPDHVHLLVTPKSEPSLPSAMRDVNWRYSRHANAAQGRTGSLWDGRYKACIVDAKEYFFACCRYVELNPLRIGIAQDPETYRWSSFKSNALGMINPILTPHPLYLSLGTNAAARAAAYLELFDQPLPESTVAAIRAATNGDWALGNNSFEARVTRHAGRNMTPRGPGRPWPEKAEQRERA